MMSDIEYVKVFLSSPSDVDNDRDRVVEVLLRLNSEFFGEIEIVPVRWEESYYTATKDFQSQIPAPADCDLVICLFWKRLGTQLPPETFRRSDGSTYSSGTEYEFENAHAHAISTGSPDILVYRKTAKVYFEAGDQLPVQQAQYQALDTFWRKWFISDTGHFRAAYHTYQHSDDLERLIEAHLRNWISRRERAPWPASKGSPFRGLEPFEEAHASVFFGRSRLVEQIRAKLIGADLRGCAFLLLIGASGSGKSSVVRAGVVPRIQGPGAVPEVDQWNCCIFRPNELGQDMIDGFCTALYASCSELSEGDFPQPTDLASLMRSMPVAATIPIKAALDRIAARERKRRGYTRESKAKFMVVIDQFEELFERSGPALEALVGALDALCRSGAIWVISTLRSDFYERFLTIPKLVRMKEDGAQVDVLPPGPAEIRDIIRRPASAAGLKFERSAETGLGIDEELERSASEAGFLPLLQFTLDVLYSQRDRKANLLTYATYSALGGVSGAIERVADTAFGELSEEEQEALLGAMEALIDIHPGEHLLPTARTALRREVVTSDAARRAVDLFVSKRLLVSGHDATGVTLRVAHEALLVHWSKARGLVAGNLDFYRARSRVEVAELEWRHRGELEDYLLPSGRPLAEAVDILGRKRTQLSERVVAYIEKSQVAEEIRWSSQRDWEAAIDRERFNSLQKRARIALWVSGMALASLGLLIVSRLFK